jgi:hypothetical protein
MKAVVVRNMVAREDKLMKEAEARGAAARKASIDEYWNSGWKQGYQQGERHEYDRWNELHVNSTKGGNKNFNKNS